MNSRGESVDSESPVVFYDDSASEDYEGLGQRDLSNEESVQILRRRVSKPSSSLIQIHGQLQAGPSNLNSTDPDVQSVSQQSFISSITSGSGPTDFNHSVRDNMSESATESRPESRRSSAASVIDEGSASARSTSQHETSDDAESEAVSSLPDSKDSKVRQYPSFFSKLSHAFRFKPNGKKPPVVGVNEPVGVKATNKHHSEFSDLFLTQSIRVHEGTIWTLKFSPDGSYLASGGQDGKIVIWSVGLGSESGAPPSSSSNEIPPANAENNGEADTRDLKFQLLSRTPFRIFQDHSADVIDLAWSRSNFLLSASVDKSVRLWHVSRDDCLQVFRHTDLVTGVAFHPTHDRYFVSSCFDRRVRIWDIIPDGSVKDWCHAPDIITAVSFTPDGTEVAVGLYFGQVYFYDAEGLKYKGQILCQNSSGSHRHGAKVTGLEFHRTTGGDITNSSGSSSSAQPGVTARRVGRLNAGAVQLLVTTNDSNTRLVNMVDSTIICKYKGSRNSSMQIRSTFSEDGQYVICGSETGKVYMWNTFLDEENLRTSVFGGQAFRFLRSTKDGVQKNSSYENFYACGTQKSALRSPSGSEGATAEGNEGVAGDGAPGCATIAALFAPSASVLQACAMNHLSEQTLTAEQRANLCSKVIVAANSLGSIEVFARRFW